MIHTDPPEDLDLARLALELMAIPSPTGQEAAVVRAVELWAGAHGLQHRRVPVAGDRDDLLLSGAAAPQILLSTHLDTVPGGPDPALRDGVLHGRGACDAKGIAAAMMAALLDLRAAGEQRVGLLLLVGEETHSDGARAAAAALDPVALLINGEPTELRFVRAQRGALAFTVHARGEPCHSGYPELGRSAVHALLDGLARLRGETWPADPEIGPTLVNVGTVQGGSAPNVLAAEAEAAVMMRVATPVDAVEARVRELLGAGLELRVRTRSDPQHLRVPAGRPDCVVGFASDVAHLRPLGPAMMVGPGSIHVAHTDHEQIRVAELEEARRLYVALCRELLDGESTDEPG